VGKNSLNFINSCISYAKEDVIGFEPLADVGCIILTPLVSIYYLVRSPFSYQEPSVIDLWYD